MRPTNLPIHGVRRAANCQNRQVAGNGNTADPASPGTRTVVEGTSSTTSELFFDLVFVFAFVQVTDLLTDDFTVRGVIDGLLVLAILWWAWSVSVWLANRVRADYGLTRAALLAVTAVLFLLALATEEAFDDIPGGLNGPVVFAICYLTVRVLLLGLRWYALPEMGTRDLVVLALPMIGGSALLFAAALVPQRLFTVSWQVDAAQTVLWAAAVAVDFGVGMSLPARRRILSARHWAERHGLLVLVALGESIIAIGLSSLAVPMSGWLVWASVLGIVVAASLEWLYFDVVALAGEQSLRLCPAAHCVSLARDAYTFLHLPMIAGIILYAAGLKRIVAVGNQAGASDVGTLDVHEMSFLYGGVALFLLGHTAFQLRITNLLKTIIWPRLTVAVVLIAMIPLTSGTQDLAALRRLAFCCVALVVVEVIIANGQRTKLREEILMQPADGEPAMDTGWSHPGRR